MKTIYSLITGILIIFALFSVVVAFFIPTPKEEQAKLTPTITPTATRSPTPTNTPTATPTVTVTSAPTPTATMVRLIIWEDESGLKTPSYEDIVYMAKVIHGEAGICSKLQKSAVAWCVCNRVDWFEYPDSIIEVITQPYQFHGYSEDKIPTVEDYEIAWDVLYRWLNDLPGRTLPKNYLFFHADGHGENVFTTNHLKGQVWDWSLPNIYEEEDN